MSSSYQMTDAIAVPSGILEVGHDGPDVVMHAHGTRYVVLDGEARDQFIKAWAAAEIEAEREAGNG